MTQNKDFKKLVRARMRKTHESYTAARQHLVRRRGAPATVRPSLAQPPAAPIDASKVGMSDAAVRAKTGKTWREWVDALDAAAAHAMPHRGIAAWLHQEMHLDAWWLQTVAVGYERIRGVREVGQRRDGEYVVNKTKTYPVPLATLYQAFAVPRLRSKWLPGTGRRIRTAAPNKSMRVTWNDGSDVEWMFYSKDPARSSVTIQHGKLASQARAAAIRAYWTERLAALGNVLDNPTRPRPRPQKTAIRKR